MENSGFFTFFINIYIEILKLKGLWLPVLNCLTQFYDHPSLEIQTKGMEIFFTLIQTNGQTFTSESWKSLSEGILIPFLQKITPTFLEKEQSQECKIINTGIFNYLVDLISTFYANLEQIVFYLIQLVDGLILWKNEVFYCKIYWGSLLIKIHWEVYWKNLFNLEI